METKEDEVARISIFIWVRIRLMQIFLFFFIFFLLYTCIYITRKDKIWPVRHLTNQSKDQKTTKKRILLQSKRVFLCLTFET